VSSGDTASCQASLTISERPLEAPGIVQEHLKALEGSWTRPDGEELIDAMSVGRCARELSCGFYYRWRWPRRESPEVIERWLKARKEWHKELREKLKISRPHMDSPLLCAKAAIRWQKGYTHVERDEVGVEVRRVHVAPRSTSGPLPVWPSLCWSEWEEVRDSAKPETEPVWISDFLAEDVFAWLKEGPGVAFCDSTAVARKVRQFARERGFALTYAGTKSEGGDQVIKQLEQGDGKESVLASINAHGTGKHLHMFDRSLVIEPPASGDEWEQVLGRLHRNNQKSDEVNFWTYQHTEPFKRALDKARMLSEHIGLLHGIQRLHDVVRWTF
jgi:hypothetical protein